MLDCLDAAMPSPEVPLISGNALPEEAVLLADGQFCSLAGLSCEQLQQLQWEQERKFARAIMALPAGSHDRALVIGQAYDTVCSILAAQAAWSQPGQKGLVMGLDPRYVKLVLEVLQRQVNAGFGQPRLFEVGYGSGLLLAKVAQQGYDVGGIEISSTMRDQALERLGASHAEQLLLGTLGAVTRERLAGRPTLVYWNDVFEHIPVDEIDAYLQHIYRLLAPRGWLLTITPNWLLRPSDVTADFCPPRTEAQGLHLKEYRLAEVTRLLKRNGFQRVATPLFSTHGKIYLAGSGGRLLKQWAEPLLDRLPVHWARFLCRGLAMSCTLAVKQG
jgi:2-polyprenyl-3-methyl-5-hydroxy-6-metoxy-1,4-benzoquinol methylase